MPTYKHIAVYFFSLFTPRTWQALLVLCWAPAGRWATLCSITTAAPTPTACRMALLALTVRGPVAYHSSGLGRNQQEQVRLNPPTPRTSAKRARGRKGRWAALRPVRCPPTPNLPRHSPARCRLPSTCRRLCECSRSRMRDSRRRYTSLARTCASIALRQSISRSVSSSWRPRWGPAHARDSHPSLTAPPPIRTQAQRKDAAEKRLQLELDGQKKETARLRRAYMEVASYPDMWPPASGCTLQRGDTPTKLVCAGGDGSCAR